MGNLKTWNTARVLSTAQSGDDSAVGVDAVMGEINYADSSEYKVNSNKKKAKRVAKSDANGQAKVQTKANKC